MVARSLLVDWELVGLAFPGKLAVFITVWREKNRNPVYSRIAAEFIHLRFSRLTQKSETAFVITKSDQVPANIRNKHRFVFSSLQPYGLFALIHAFISFELRHLITLPSIIKQVITVSIKPGLTSSIAKNSPAKH